MTAFIDAGTASMLMQMMMFGLIVLVGFVLLFRAFGPARRKRRESDPE